MFGESFKFFDSPTTKWRSFNFFAKLNGNQILMATFSKFHKYQTFGLTELHNVSKGQLADRIFIQVMFRKAVFTITGSSNIQFLKFWLFNFSNFQIQTNFVKNFMKKLPVYKIDFESTDKVLPLQQYIWSEISRQWNNSPLIFFFFFFFLISTEERFAS